MARRINAKQVTMGCKPLLAGAGPVTAVMRDVSLRMYDPSTFDPLEPVIVRAAVIENIAYHQPVDVDNPAAFAVGDKRPWVFTFVPNGKALAPWYPGCPLYTEEEAAALAVQLAERSAAHITEADFTSDYSIRAFIMENLLWSRR